MLEVPPVPACCPLCDNAIMEQEPAKLYFDSGAKCLAHEVCMDELEESEDYDDQ